MFKMIKFIYFDVGGVVIKDFSGTNKWQELKRGIGIKPEENESFDKFFDKYRTELCLSRDIKNPDSSFSMEPLEFKEMVKNIRDVEKALGKISFELSEEEIPQVNSCNDCP